MDGGVSLQSFVKARPHLLWYVKDFAELSVSSVVEHTLNYGTWHDVQELFTLLGTEEVAKVFAAGQREKRNNYRPAIANYFRLYFAEHATH